MKPTPETRPAAARKLQPLAQLAPFLRPYRGTLILAFIALTVAASATLVLPTAVRSMIDLGFSKANAEHINRYFLALFAVAMVLALATSARFYLVSWIGERVVADIRSAVYAHVIKMNPAFFETTQTGEVLSRLTTDTTLVQTVIGSSASIGLRNIFTLVGGLIMLTITSPRLSGLIMILVPIIVLPIVMYGRKVRSLSRATQDRIADSSAMAGETLNAVQTVQAFTQERFEIARFTRSVEVSFTTALQRIRTRALLTAIVILFIFGAVVLVLWVGAQAVLNGSMSSGQLGQFILYAVIVAGSVGILSEVWGEIQRAAGATERLMELLAIEAKITTPENPLLFPLSGNPDICFDQVSFYYPARPEHAALDNFTLTIKSGETIALVGPSGAGKSTVFQLLLRFYDPQSGHITLDNIDISQATPESVREHMSIVPQDTVIFATDAMENIRYGRRDASDAEVIAAARAAVADEFLERLPLGYHTFLGERGIRLSGGQKQRIAIARAILKNPPIMLLDEATSALDAESERLVQLALEHLMQNRTTIVIAHRLATVLKADRIVVMEDGHIVASGTHQELMKENGLYARLATLQFNL